MAYPKKPAFDYELIKNVSLRQINPIALADLRKNGSVTFSLLSRSSTSTSQDTTCVASSLSLYLFYASSARTRVSMPCTLIEHKYRVRAVAATGEEYRSPAVAADGFRIGRILSTAVAIGSGV